MFKRAFGLLAFLIGAALGIFMIGMMITGKMNDVSMITKLKMLIMPTLLVAFGITWMRGMTFGGGQ